MEAVDLETHAGNSERVGTLLRPISSLIGVIERHRSAQSDRIARFVPACWLRSSFGFDLPYILAAKSQILHIFIHGVVCQNPPRRQDRAQTEQPGREALRIQPGESLVMHAERRPVRIESYPSRIDRIGQSLARLIAPDRRLSNQRIAQRAPLAYPGGSQGPANRGEKALLSAPSCVCWRLRRRGRRGRLHGVFRSRACPSPACPWPRPAHI
jgi:hypothetical protein